MKTKTKSVRLPEAMVNEIHSIITDQPKYGYESVVEFVRWSVRRALMELTLTSDSIPIELCHQCSYTFCSIRGECKRYKKSREVPPTTESKDSHYVQQ